MWHHWVGWQMSCEEFWEVDRHGSLWVSDKMLSSIWPNNWLRRGGYIDMALLSMICRIPRGRLVELCGIDG